MATTNPDELLTPDQLTKAINALDETEKDINKILASVEDPKEIPIDDLDVTIDNSLLGITKTSTEINKSNSDTELSQQTTPDDLRTILIDQLRKMEPDKRVQFITNLAKMQQVNQNGRQYSNLTDNHRENLKKKLREKKEQLAMQRASKYIKLKKQEQYDNAMADINNKIQEMLDTQPLEASSDSSIASPSEHVHDETCKHLHDDEIESNANVPASTTHTTHPTHPSGLSRTQRRHGVRSNKK